MIDFARDVLLAAFIFSPAGITGKEIRMGLIALCIVFMGMWVYINKEQRNDH